jgi:protease-4
MNFFKSLLAAFIGTLIAVLVLILVLIGWISSSSEQPEPYVRQNSVLTIELSGSIPDRSPENPFAEAFSFSEQKKVDKRKLHDNLLKARSDKRISGVILKLAPLSDGWASLEDVHKMVKTFADSTDKFLYAYTSEIGYNEKAYFIATATDSIFAPPASFFEFDGFYSQTTFYTGLLDKLGITPELAKKGKYKSAVEPYYLKEHSENSEYQLAQILEETTSLFVDAVAQKTGKSTEEVNALLADLPSLDVTPAYEEGLLDELVYENELQDQIRTRLKLDSAATVHEVELKRYDRVPYSSASVDVPETSNRVAVLYAEGMILPEAPSDFPGDGASVITATKFKKTLNKIRDNKDVKALVVRINSPGGAGTTSDLIWHMLRETSKDIPVIASMGNVAASGGYYIAMAADTIVAQPTTITGSIGVFSTKFNANELLTDKLSLTFDEVKSHPHADWLNGTRGFTEAEAKAFQRQADRFYETFVEKVSQRRPLDWDAVHERAQGRVWTGSDALEQKLVDVIGDLPKAIEVAAEKAELDQYLVSSYPKPKPLFELLMQQSATQAQSWINSTIWPTALGEQAGAQEILRDALLKRNQSVMAWLPYQIEIQ